jgi:hypothetical protein
MLSHRAIHLDGGVPLYHDDIEPAKRTCERPTIVLVQGEGFTGLCYLSTTDGRTGWPNPSSATGTA